MSTSKKTLTKLFEEIQQELSSLNEEELSVLASGFEGRGLDCIVQRWYLPDRLKEGAISEFAGAIRELQYMLEDITEDDSQEYQGYQEDESDYDEASY